MYDFIGDIHGRHDSLVQLLSKMGYSQKKGIWQHPTRKAFFLGDLIDNGPQIRETLDLVKNMMQEGFAAAVLGNHEFNFICYHLKSKTQPEQYLRPHTLANTQQCQATIDQLGNKKIDHYLQWMWQLPVFAEQETFRAVHACWHQKSIEALQQKLAPGNLLTPENIHTLFDKKNKPESEIKIVLKGPKFKLPEQYAITDKYGETRKKIRAGWWNLKERPAELHADFDYLSFIKDIEVPHYPSDHKPVFFGHYYKTGTPVPYLTAQNAQCLDFGVEDEGHLTCYRFDNEQILLAHKLDWVEL